MKIKKIQINNIGPYVNQNCFDFDIESDVKRMVLIGGKNGAGKTTLFNAIKICLYGCVAYGFEANNARYYAEVEKLINTGEKLKKTGEAEVTIDLFFDDGKDNYTYTFNRKWKVTGKRITETFLLFKNGSVLTSTERNDFENYLLQVLPPNLFKFYFFDGEKISEFVFNSNKNSDFKDAFLKLCNLDTMDIIRENFRRVSRSKSKDSENIAQEYERCIEKDNLNAGRIERAEEEYQEITNNIISIDDQLVALEKSYSKTGGISKKQWREMQDTISKEENEREERRKWLKDTANNVLPFVIMRNDLEKLKKQIELEHKAQIGTNVKEAINSPDIKNIVTDVLLNSGVELAKDITGKIVYEIANYADLTITNVDAILNLSEFDGLDLISQINSHISFDISRIKDATNSIDASLKHVKRIRNKMERSSVDNYEEYLKLKSDLNEKKSACLEELVRIDGELQQYRTDKAVSSSKLAKAKSDYEALLKKRSINDISARALLAFDELQTILYKRSIRKVEEWFEIYFKSLINKSDLIDGIYIDNSLNVLPYKNKTFSKNFLTRTIDRNGSEHLIAQIGLHAYEVFQAKLEQSEDEVVLPVEVKQQLSAGEKQVFIMALYQALSQLNSINVPYIVDTPFARIDKEHRSKILKEFFKSLKGQIIILSTDEEIVGEYYDVISDIISNTFMLKHSISGNTEVISDSYFGGQI